uniref:LRRGT00040 n=1 Tax=Rattus norvegicus TaxID=10116 RepID=Q6TXF9_RAT|nr:LRRGT00040 [Rattus norvegicus]
MTKKQVGEERVYPAYTSTLLFITKGSQDWNSSRGFPVWDSLFLESEFSLADPLPKLTHPWLLQKCFPLFVCVRVIAADCKRVTVLKYFLEALCGQEEPLLAFKGGKYVSVAPVPDTMGKEMGIQEGKQLEDEYYEFLGTSDHVLNSVQQMVLSIDSPNGWDVQTL